LLLTLLFVLALAAGTNSALAQKNFYDCKWENISTHYLNSSDFNAACKLMRDNPEILDFRFAPYDQKDAASLVTDSTLQRAVGDTKGNAGDARKTAFFSVCAEGGWLIGVYCEEPLLKGKGEKVPESSFEIFFAPGTGDELKNECYYQLIVELPAAKLTDYPYMSEGKDFRRLKDYVRIKTSVLPEGAWLTTIYIPWEALYDKIPLSLDKNNLWRFSIVRWGPDGGFSWGGKVHETGAAGYIRWPRPTEKQLANIYRNIINGAWKKYQTEVSAISANMSNLVRDRSFAEASAEAAIESRALANQQADKEFFDSKIKPMLKENDAIGEQVQKIKTLKFSELELLYSKVGRLSNCQYLISEARRDYLLGKMFKK